MKNRIEYKGFYIDKTEMAIVSVDKKIRKSILISRILIHRIGSQTMYYQIKIPTRCGCYYLESHIRLSYDENYIRKIREYIKVKQSKSKQMYYNPGRKRSGGNF